MFKEEKYLKEAVDCAEVIWQRGLLRKGYGICHGTAGNGYAFLTLYKLTQEKKYLYRACKVRQGLRNWAKLHHSDWFWTSSWPGGVITFFQFAEWCLDYGTHGCRIPDRPYSLFEGTTSISLCLPQKLLWCYSSRARSRFPPVYYQPDEPPGFTCLLTKPSVVCLF